MRPQNCGVKAGWIRAILISASLLAFALAPSALGQQNSYNATHAKSTKTKESLPRSTSSSIPDSVGSKAVGKSQELHRLERTNTKKTAGVHHATTTSKTLPSHGDRISFNYTGPKPGQAGHRNSTTRSH